MYNGYIYTMAVVGNEGENYDFTDHPESNENGCQNNHIYWAVSFHHNIYKDNTNDRARDVSKLF